MRVCAIRRRRTHRLPRPQIDRWVGESASSSWRGSSGGGDERAPPPRRQRGRWRDERRGGMGQHGSKGARGGCVGGVKVSSRPGVLNPVACRPRGSLPSIDGFRLTNQSIDRSIMHACMRAIYAFVACTQSSGLVVVVVVCVQVGSKQAGRQAGRQEGRKEGRKEGSKDGLRTERRNEVEERKKE